HALWPALISGSAWPKWALPLRRGSVTTPQGRPQDSGAITGKMGLRGTAFRLLVVCGVGASLLVATALPTAADDISDALARLQTINRLKGTLKDNLQRA